MNGSLETFRASYAQGQRFDWGEQPQLMNHLEGLGGGLPTDEKWERGGPLLVEFAGGRQILAWMRGLPFEEGGRVNAWEAWGIVGPLGSFMNWPAFWEELSAPPDQAGLAKIAKAVHLGDLSSFPEMPSNLAVTLENLYLSEAAHQTIPMHTPADLPLLAWSYLLGPAEWKTASVGPPRRIPMVSSAPFTYQGHIVETGVAQQKAWSSPLIAAIVDEALFDFDSAREKVIELRRLSPADRRKRVLAPPPRPARETVTRAEEVYVQHQQTKRKPVAGDATQPRAAAVERMRTLEKRVTAIGAMLVALLLLSLGNLYYLRKIAAKVGAIGAVTETPAAAPVPNPETGTLSTTDTTPVMTATTGTSSTPANATIACADWWMRPEDRARVVERVRATLAANRITPARAAARTLAANAQWDEVTTPNVLADMSVQLDLRALNCYQGTIDGDAGAGTEAAIGRCGARYRITSRDESLQKLCTWAQP